VIYSLVETGHPIDMMLNRSRGFLLHALEIRHEVFCKCVFDPEPAYGNRFGGGG
jgi:hypothetical protein